MTFYVGRELRKKDNTPPRPGLFLSKLKKFLERGFCPPQKIVSIFFTTLPHRRAFLVFYESYFQAKGYRYSFTVTCIGGWLVGCQSKNQVSPLGKVFVPQTFVWCKCLINYLVFYESYFQAKGYRYSFTVTCIGGWLVGCQSKNQVSPLGKVFVPQTFVWCKCLINYFLAGKKTGKTSIVSGFTCVPGRETEYVCRYVYVRVDKRARMCAVRVHTWI